MSFLHDVLAKFKADAAKAFDLADPHAYLAEKEAEFKAAIAEAHDQLHRRIVVLEALVATLMRQPTDGTPPSA